MSGSIMFSPSVSTAATPYRPDSFSANYSKDYSAGKFNLNSDENGYTSSFTTDSGITINNYYDFASDGANTKVDGYALTTSESDGISDLINKGADPQAGSGGSGIIDWGQFIVDAEINRKKGKKGGAGGAGAEGGGGGGGEGGALALQAGGAGATLSGSMQVGDATVSGSIGVGSAGESNGLSAEEAIEGNWFIQLAEALGKLLNKLADKLKATVDSVKLGSDGQAPFKDAMRIQALSQELQFISQALMTALNSLGDAIKTTVTAGGAAR